MIRILIHDLGGKGVDFGIVTDPSSIVRSAVFLTDKPVEIGDYCLIDDGGFLTQEEQQQLLYGLASEASKNSS